MAAPSDTKPELVVRYRDRTAQFFTEDGLTLTSGQTALEMVLIPEGEFMMGCPEDEQGRDIYETDESLKGFDIEAPQHLVTVPSFFMSKYPVTQAQWRAVVALPQVEQVLEQDPANFEGDNRPVEQVSWHDAMEFCARLQKHTGKPYRLPSEAEWEYACRAGTTTPFHFGNSITTNLANYRGTDWEYKGKTYSGAYGDGSYGEFREETTDVGSFEIANAFGLYDMHGNVWEWCLDCWHKTYDGAPTDGSAWISFGETEYRVLRGGSWGDPPAICRSATRLSNTLDRLDDNGFRLVCGSARTS
ncbi:formylglycine-generating enzyme family protein [Adonisia turfae]|uniref:Formylglycine-generating enzyme family protein n=1 Tax=Adonisia turfae CCMR0081 TaxID=2292702 RepID=A0A6M0RDD7_9CYAN|nr:formylglycine-generating enzyme family protein [Adonisia turfae]NEZ54309.1 formylglycine-generating enzyme family protein [Adonisia turfae CCMR0081]